MSSSLLLTKSRRCCAGSLTAAVVLCIVSISHLALIARMPLAQGLLLFQNDSAPGTTRLGTSSETGEASEGEGGLVFTVPSSIRPNEDPENTNDIVKKARANQFSAEMVTNRTRAMVSCESGEILVRINFTEPFRGVGYADYDRSSPCRIEGTGDTYYEMRLPLRGCGTKQEKPRLFINNIVLRFHRSLELQEDEAKTIVCRYPPPQAPDPPPAPGAPARVIQAPPEPARLTQYEPFILIAGLLFFALLLAGLGTTSYVTRQQKITEINTPLPITSTTEYDTYQDNESIITTEDIKTTQKIIPLPKYSTHTVDDVFITKIHEVDTMEDLIHHKRHLPRAPHLEHRQLDDTYIRNEHEIECEETLEQARLENQRNLGRKDLDDAYLTNQDEIVEDERLTHHRMRQMEEPKLEMRTIEDTFITNVDEIVEKVDTTYHKGYPSGRGELELELERGGRMIEQPHQYQRHRSPGSHPRHTGEHFEEFESRLENLRR